MSQNIGLFNINVVDISYLASFISRTTERIWSFTLKAVSSTPLPQPNRLVAEVCASHTQDMNIHAFSGIRTRNSSSQTPVDLRLGPDGLRDRSGSC